MVERGPQEVHGGQPQLLAQVAVGGHQAVTWGQGADAGEDGLAWGLGGGCNVMFIEECALTDTAAVRHHVDSGQSVGRGRGQIAHPVHTHLSK